MPAARRGARGGGARGRRGGDWRRSGGSESDLPEVLVRSPRRLGAMEASADSPIARRLGTLGSQLQLLANARAAAVGAQEEDAHTGTNVMANTVIMPSIGLGCAYVPDQASGGSQWDIATGMIEAALEAGVRHFDTAQRYGTEAPLGAVLARRFKNGTLRREDVFVTTKTSNPRPASGGMPAGGGWIPDGAGYMLSEDADAYAGLTAELNGCLETLQLDYVDLALIHYPSLPSADGPGLPTETRRRKRRECWAALQDAYWSGKCRAIGVSNFETNHLEELFSCAFGSPFHLPGTRTFSHHPIYENERIVATNEYV